MFCPKCGTMIPDGENNCSQCGTSLNNGIPSKNAQFKQQILSAGSSVLVMWVLSVVCALLLIFGAKRCVNCFFGDIPIVKWIVGEDTVSEMKEDFSRSAEFLEEYVEEGFKKVKDLGEDELREFELKTGVSADELGKIKIKKLIKIFSSPSIGGMSKFYKAFKNTDDAEIFGIFKTIKNVTFAIAFVFAICTLVAAYFKKKWISLTVYILSIPFYILLVGTVYLILATLANILLAIFISKIKKETVAA